MILVDVLKSQPANGVVRVTGTVQYDDGILEEYWFELPDSYTPASSGNPWLAILLPLAATVGEDLHIPLAVDPELLRGAESVLRLWAFWRKEMHLVNITIGSLEAQPFTERTTASFFSAGVDSTFTVLRRPDVKNWITVQGFDMPITKNEAFKHHCERLSAIAGHYQASFIPVRTNIRETRWKKTHWELSGFGPALAAVALMFENHFHEVLLPASCDYSALDPWGSHPLSDPLFSTVNTKIVHEGTAYSRTEKIEYLSRDRRALNELHVCFRGEDANGQDNKNCCRCEKCYRTMIALDLFGKLDDAVLFDRSKYQIERISRIYMGHEIDEVFFLNLHTTALERGRNDVADQISVAIRRSRKVRKLARFAKLPAVWRPAQALTKHMLRDSLK